MNTDPYPSDLSDEEWSTLGPLISPGMQAGRRQVLELRRIVDAVFCLLRTGCELCAEMGDGGVSEAAYRGG
jgi:transposase